MSRIGKNPIQIPPKVTIEKTERNVSVKGPKGELKLELRPEIDITITDDRITVVVISKSKTSNAYWGLTRALLANMVFGVCNGFEKKLELVGVGYRAKSTPKGISLSLGFSHTIEITAPEGIEINVPENTSIVISGIDKQLVGLTAAGIRKLRKPEPYKGKGIRYEGEKVRRKAGKSAKA